MGINAMIRKRLNHLLQRYGYGIVPSQLLYDWQKYPMAGPSFNRSSITEEIENYLQPHNPRLKQLADRYASFSEDVISPLTWQNNYITPEDILYFRGDNGYVWQLRGLNMNIMAYALTAYYVKSIDSLGLLQRLDEDDWFGVIKFSFDNKIVSRDLLDSIIEIHFLEKHLQISSYHDLSILDIGAGYGRLAHRMVSAMPNISRYLCTDAVAVSTFISEFYLRFRKLEQKAKVMPIDEIEDALKSNPVDVALNIHSFSECRIQAIEWWLSLLVKYKVEYLMIVPNSHRGGTFLLTNNYEDFSSVIEKNGYELIAKEPKYNDPVVQQFAINPTYYYLFKLQK